MATQAQRAARRRQRARRAQRSGGRRVVGYTGPTDVPHIMSVGRNGGAGNGFPSRRRRQGRGLLSQIGGALFPGLGGTVGQIGDNLIGSLLGGGRSVAAPVATAGRFRAMQANRSDEHGVEQISTVTVPAGTPAGTIILQVPIAAPTIGVRLATFSRLWTKTIFKNLVVEVTSSNPSSVSGNYTLAIDPDPAQTYDSSEALPARLMALTMANRANAWADTCLQMIPNLRPLFNRFHLEGASDAEIREYAAGQLIMATTTDYAEDCEYTVNVGWDVAFEKPDTTPDVEDLVEGRLFMNTSGLQYTVPSNTTLSIAAASRAFNRSNVGDFNIAVSDLLRVAPEDGTAPHSLQVSNIAYTAASDTMLISLTTSVNPPLVAGTLGTQVPIPYTINTGTSSERRLVKVGYGLIHPVFLRRNRQELGWYDSALRRHRTKLATSDVKAALSAARIKRLQDEDEEVLEELLEKLSVSKG